MIQNASSIHIPELHYTTLFEALAGNNVLLQTDAPRFTILAASTMYLQQTGYAKAAMIGKGIFEAFPGNSNPHDTGENDLRNSLDYVLEHKKITRITSTTIRSGR